MSFSGFGWYVAFSLDAYNVYICLYYVCTGSLFGYNCIVSLYDAHYAAEMCMCWVLWVCAVQKCKLFF